MRMWVNAPLSKTTASLDTKAPATAADTAGAAIGAAGATNTPHAPVTEQEEPVSAILPGSTLVPAVEVGIVNQQLVCVGDPSLEDQWLEAQTQGHTGFTVPELELDASTTPVEAMLLVCTRSHWLQTDRVFRNSVFFLPPFPNTPITSEALPACCGICMQGVFSESGLCDETRAELLQ